ncbi:FAD-binding oxidoreductase [Roseateles puraquae]|uniref:FAD-binding oxidoreductase n=1 Tax=Roseateles puraquae TaxID=431059 RepID=A0A254N8Z4_9BURK|nr:FAD-binding oxidoreductase [Roseateles puraquae]MDG0856683.1 FAD-binding oxidoreductase [Roseateles puraquae]OWR04465.1 FAD-binding oxidoreductase [Roseateles puraquae]
MTTARVQAWGRLEAAEHAVHRLTERSAPLPAAARPGLPHGNGRSYGDVALNPGGTLWMTRGLDRFISFDAATGVLACEAGVLLDEIIRVALPQGWFLPVTPGTRFVTVGGAIANDVHGKNHHGQGSFGHHVLGLSLLRTDGERIDCGPGLRPAWFAATVGGLGLTGVILTAQLQLMPVRSEWMQGESQPFRSLAEFFALSAAAETRHDYVVSWLDCVHASGSGQDARGILFSASHATEGPPPPPPARARRVPLTPPVSLINGLSLRAFNQAYFHRHAARAGAQRQHLLPFFYPLDSLLEWNRIYGPRGFHQYQCALPRRDEQAATAELLKAIRASGQGSFLAVLKTFGEREGLGLLSFPLPGTTVALDFPDHGASTLALFDRLDAIVREAGGRLYPAKDGRQSRAMFEAGYPRHTDFLAFRDPGLSSAMSRRIFGH